MGVIYLTGLTERVTAQSSRGQRHHGLDGSCFRCVLCCHVDLIESVGTNESVEGQTALPAQFDEPWNELPGVAVSLVGAGQANAPAEQVRHVDGDLRSQRRSADDDACSGGSQRGDRLTENGQPAAGLDRVLCAEASGQSEQRWHRVIVCRIDRVGRPEFGRQLQAGGVHVDGDDPRCRREHRGHDRDQADAAGAEDDDGAPRLRACDVEDRPGAGLDAAAQWCELRQVGVVVDLHRGPGADQGMSGKRGLAEEMPMQITARARESGAAVEPGSAEQIERDPLLTVHNLAGLAGWAASAGIEAEYHLVANAEVAYLGSYLVHDTGAFVAQHSRQRKRGCLRANAQIRMAHADRSDLDDKLVSARFADLYLFELERTVLRSDNCSDYLHPRPLLEGRSVPKPWTTRRSARRSCTPETPPVRAGRSAGRGRSVRSRLPRTGRRRGPRCWSTRCRRAAAVRPAAAGRCRGTRSTPPGRIA